jgi:hypothetical protein
MVADEEGVHVGAEGSEEDALRGLSETVVSIRLAFQNPRSRKSIMISPVGN